MIYIVSDGRIVTFPDATVAKMAGGNVIHIIRGDDIIGNFPAKNVRYYGTELPPTFQEDYKNQLAWEGLSPEERALRKGKAVAARKALPTQATEGPKSGQEK